MELSFAGLWILNCLLTLAASQRLRPESLFRIVWWNLFWSLASLVVLFTAFQGRFLTLSFTASTLTLPDWFSLLSRLLEVSADDHSFILRTRTPSVTCSLLPRRRFSSVVDHAIIWLLHLLCTKFKFPYAYSHVPTYQTLTRPLSRMVQLLRELVCILQPRLQRCSPRVRSLRSVRWEW